MKTLYNEITIEAPIAKIWAALSNIEELEKYDPTVKSAVAVSPSKSGIGSIRKVVMQDGKNWFEEKVTVCEANEALVFELTACSFPIHQLKHSYSFTPTGNQTKVMQTMEYQVKFGLLGRLIDALVIRKQSDKGIKLFFSGLKTYTEKH